MRDSSSILGRARLFFGILVILLVSISIVGIYQGISSGDFDRVFIQPFRQLAPLPSPLPSPTISISPVPTPTPSVKTPPSVKQQSQPVVANCIRKNIREGEFASNKCYLPQDYEDLEYYLGRFSAAVLNRDSAESSMRITCNCRVPQECEFFKNSCEKDKQKKSQAETDIQKYKATIQGIITRGK